MDLSWVIFGLLLAMCAVMGAALVIEEVPFTEQDGGKTYQGHGVAHDRFATMLQGGPGEERHGTILWVGAAFGLLQCALFVTLLIFGSRKSGKAGPMLRPLLIGGAIYLAIFAALVVSYSHYLPKGSDVPLFVSFPVPTAWMLYGVWGLPLFFVLLYVVTFKSWSFRDEDLVAFRALVKERTRTPNAPKDSA